MKLAAIASRILEHLKRFENDPIINAPLERRGMKMTPYFHVNCFRHGANIGIVYISYQGHFTINKSDAIKYLEWLDAGNVGHHGKALHHE